MCVHAFMVCLPVAACPDGVPSTTMKCTSKDDCPSFLYCATTIGFCCPDLSQLGSTLQQPRQMLFPQLIKPAEPALPIYPRQAVNIAPLQPNRNVYFCYPC